MKKKRTFLSIVGLVLSTQLLLSHNALNMQTVEAETSNKMVQTQFKKSKVKKELVVIVEIFEEGYKQMAGKKDFFVKGDIPKDSQFVETLLPPKDYQFDKKDEVRKLDKGSIIKIKDKFYYFTKEKGEKGALLTVKEAQELTKNVKIPKKTAGIPGVDKPTDDGFILTSEKDIITKTEEGIVVNHNGHAHFIYYHDLKESKWAYLVPNTTQSASTIINSHQPVSVSNMTLSDGYVFHSGDIVAEDTNGYTVKHGDHFHYIWKESPQSSIQTQKQPQTLAPSLPVDNSRLTHVSSNAEIAGIDYPTSDGFQFDGTGIVGETALGLLVRHGKHDHLIPYTDLVNTRWAGLISTKNQPESALAEKSVANNSEQDDLSAKIEEKLTLIMKRYGLEREKIMVDREKNAIIFPHGDHTHAEPIDEKKPYAGGHSHTTYEIFKPEEGIVEKSDHKIFSGQELENAIKLLKNQTFNNQDQTLDNGQKRVSFVFGQGIEKLLGTNVKVQLTTPDGQVLDKLSGYVFGRGVGNIANFELDRPYDAGEEFSYKISSKDYPEVAFEGTFKVNKTLSYDMAKHAVIEPFYAGDSSLKLNAKLRLRPGTEALVRIFDEVHGKPYIENNYHIGEIILPIPELNRKMTEVIGNVIPITFMANPYEHNETYYVLDVPVLDPKNRPELPQNTQIQPENPMAEKSETQPTDPNEVSNDIKPEMPQEMPMLPTPNIVPDMANFEANLIAFAKQYGLGLQNYIIDAQGGFQLVLETGELVPFDASKISTNSNSNPVEILPESESGIVNGEIKPDPNAERPDPRQELEGMLWDENYEDWADEEPAGQDETQVLQAKLIAFAAQYGLGLDSVLTLADGSMVLQLTSGEQVPIDLSQL